MKTELTTNGPDVIWSSNMELPSLNHEESFPVMGSCQVSSILSNLDTPSPEKPVQSNFAITQTMDLVVLPNGDYKIVNESDLNNDFICLTESTPSEIQEVDKVNSPKKQKHKHSKKIIQNDEFENMLYFVCNLCPYLCIKDSKITEHLEGEHKNKTCSSKSLQLKCPACPNIFYHKIPLRSHLIYDHKVNNSDLRKIIQAVAYFSKKGLNNLSEKVVEGGKTAALNNLSNCKNDMDLKYVEKFINAEKMISNDDSVSNDNDSSAVGNNLGVSGDGSSIEKILLVKDVRCNGSSKTQDNQILTDVVSLPLIDITHNDAEKTFGSMIKKRMNSLKYADQKKFYKCTATMCKVRLQDPSTMSYHIKCHTEGTFKCPECKEVFTFWKPLTGHLWRVHKIDMELYSCDKCDYKTFSLGKLNNIHKLIHSDLRAFACDICSKGFKNTKQLRNHKTTHKEKPDKFTHTCEICTKAFSDRRQLKVHLDSVHRKLKPFLCSYCGYKGASKSALKMHIRQHTGEKPFACNICEYSSADHNSLRRHKLRHSGFKPYKCAHCDYACIQSSTYKVHLRSKHPGLEKDFMFTCKECQFRTVNQDMYLSHMFLVHKQKVDNI